MAQGQSKYAKKKSGVKPSKAPWGFALSSLKRTTVLCPFTNNQVTVKRVSGRYINTLYSGY